MLDGAASAEAVESTMAAPSEAALDGAASAEAVESTLAAPSEAVLDGAASAEVVESTMADSDPSVAEVPDAKVTTALPEADGPDAGCDSKVPAEEDADMAVAREKTDLFGGSHDDDADSNAEGHELMDKAVISCQIHSAYDAYTAHVKEQGDLMDEEFAFGDQDGDPLADVQDFAHFLEARQESPIPEVEAAIRWWSAHLE